MSYVVNRMIVVIGYMPKEKMESLLNPLLNKDNKFCVTPIFEVCNRKCTFSVLPSGSGNGFYDSNQIRKLRQKIIEVFKDTCEVVLISFGGDQENTTIEFTTDKDENLKYPHSSSLC